MLGTFQMPLVCWSVCLFVNFFSVKDLSATTWLRILKFCTQLDSDELYCVTKTATYCLSVTFLSIFLSLFFRQLFSVKDFTGTTQLRIFEFDTNIRYYKLYCVLKNQCHIAYQSLYLCIFLSLLFISSTFLPSRICQELLDLGF